MSRPLSPDVIREHLRKLAKEDNIVSLTAGQRGALIGILNKVCKGDEFRHMVLDWAFGKESTKDLTEGEWAALWRWVQPSNETEHAEEHESYRDDTLKRTMATRYGWRGHPALYEEVNAIIHQAHMGYDWQPPVEGSKVTGFNKAGAPMRVEEVLREMGYRE